MRRFPQIKKQKVMHIDPHPIHKEKKQKKGEENRYAKRPMSFFFQPTAKQIATGHFYLS